MLTDAIYEALGSYIDNLSGSIYIGTARGKAILYLDEEYPLTPQDGILPFINVFYTGGGLELVGFWDNGGREALLLRMKPENIRVKGSTGEIEITFPSQTGALVVVTLYGNRGFAETLKSAVEACRQSDNVEERLISSRVSR